MSLVVSGASYEVCAKCNRADGQGALVAGACEVRKGVTAGKECEKARDFKKKKESRAFHVVRSSRRDYRGFDER